jgi:hypothetical protein
MPTIVNVITISEEISEEVAPDRAGKEIAKLRLLEKWYAPERNNAVGTWVVEGGNCFASGPFPSLFHENRTWHYNATSKDGLLTIGHSIGPNKPLEVHAATEEAFRSLGLDPTTYVALFGIRRGKGKFSPVSDSSPRTGLFYHVKEPGKPPTPVIWVSEWGYGEYPCPRKWVWD